MNRKPNILMIVPDQQRYDCIGYSNDYPVKTPNIDKLASEGMWFDNAYTPIPICCPARQSLLNGRRPEAFGAHWNYDISLKIPALEPTEYSWPRELNDNGYKTGYVGKWHVNPDHDPTKFGFDDYVSEVDYARFRQAKYADIKLQNSFLGETDPVQLSDSRTHWLAEKALDLMKQYENEGAPWHIRLDFPEPHLPCQPSEPFASMYDPREVPKWRSFDDDFANKPYIQKQQLCSWGIEDLQWKDWAPTVARYYAIISQVDHAIGKILTALQEMGIEEDTIVIYTPDHGDMCGGHRMMDKHYVLYDDIVRVPLIIRWPKLIKPGSRRKEFIHNVLDIPPTILDILDLDIKEFFHGMSLLPLFKGEEVQGWREEAVSTYNGQQFGLYSQRMIRNDNWKYIWNPTDVDELYDMVNDPDELNNLIHDKNHEKTISILRKKLYEVLSNEGDGLMKGPWVQKQLLEDKKL